MLISKFAGIQFRAILKWQLSERDGLPSRFWFDPVLGVSGDGCLYIMNQIDNAYFESVGCLY